MSSPTSIVPPGVFASNIITPFIIASAFAGGLVVLWAFFSSSLMGLIIGWLLKFFMKDKEMQFSIGTIAKLFFRLYTLFCLSNP
jgi:hypothetical protein